MPKWRCFNSASERIAAIDAELSKIRACPNQPRRNAIGHSHIPRALGQRRSFAGSPDLSENGYHEFARVGAFALDDGSLPPELVGWRFDLGSMF